MQDLLNPTKRRIAIATLAFAILIAALLLYYFSFSSSSSQPEGPLTIGSRRVSGGSVPAKINETISFGFNVKNSGAAPITMKSAEVSPSDKQLELVELVFINYTYEVVGIINGTAEENGFVTFPIQGFTIQPGQYAELSVAIRAPTSGNHTLTGIAFTYSYSGQDYTFEYQSSSGTFMGS